MSARTAGRTRRENSTARRPSTRQPRTRILILCGGRRTEPTYFEGLKQWVRNPAVHVKVVGSGKAPGALVDEVLKLAHRSNDDYDELWCVFDVDAFSLSGAEHQARCQRVKLAISNPCFELWLLLHHQAVQCEIADAKHATAMLRRHLPSYDKTALNFAEYQAGVDDAIRRAKGLHSDSSACGPNPSSTVWILAKQITER